MWLKFKELLPFFIALFTVLSAGLATESFLDISKYLSKDKLVIGRILKIFYIVFFFCMAYLWYRQRNTFFRPRTRYLANDKKPGKRKHLVLFLSNTKDELLGSRGIPQEFKLSSDIHTDVQMFNRLKKENPSMYKWSWEMPLRAIEYHCEVLESITFICSNKSIKQLHLFFNICRNYEQLKNITYYTQINDSNTLSPLSDNIAYNNLQGFDFENFDQLSRALTIVRSEFKKKHYQDQEIMIDITGGQKPTSVIGASITFNLKIKAQYVQTNDPWHVVSYDVLLASSETGGLGL